MGDGRNISRLIMLFVHVFLTFHSKKLYWKGTLEGKNNNPNSMFQTNCERKGFYFYRFGGIITLREFQITEPYKATVLHVYEIQIYE